MARSDAIAESATRAMSKPTEVETPYASYKDMFCSFVAKTPRSYQETLKPSFWSSMPTVPLAKNATTSKSSYSQICAAPSCNEIHVMRPTVIEPPKKKAGTLRVVNIVSKFKVGVGHLDLATIANDMQYVSPGKSFQLERNQKLNGLVIYHQKPFKVTARVFNTGVVTLWSAKNVMQAKTMARRTARILQKFYPSAKFLDFKITNMVGNSTGPFAVDLDKTFNAWNPESNSNLTRCSYQAELMNSIMLKVKVEEKEDAEGEVVARVASCNLFPSGKFGITGVKTIADMKKAEELIHAKMRKYEDVIRYNKLEYI